MIRKIQTESWSNRLQGWRSWIPKLPTWMPKKNLGAERQKNRPRENAFAEVLPGRPNFGVRSETIEHSNFVMATSGVLECNSHFKYPKFSPAALNNSAIWLQIVLFSTFFHVLKNSFSQTPKGRENQRRKEREKGRKKEERRKLFVRSAGASRPSAKRERRASGWEKWHPVKKYLRQLCLRHKNKTRTIWKIFFFGFQTIMWEKIEKPKTFGSKFA